MDGMPGGNKVSNTMTKRQRRREPSIIITPITNMVVGVITPTDLAWEIPPLRQLRRLFASYLVDQKGCSP